MPLLGHIDVLSRERVAGWAWDSDQPDAPVGLVVSADGRVIGRCLADQFRPDLRDAGIGGGGHGFHLELVAPLSALHDHEIALRREGDGAHLPGSPRALAAAGMLDACVRRDIERMETALAVSDLPAAIAFFAERTERLRDRLADHRSGAWDRRRRRGLGWQEPSVSATMNTAGPTTAVPRALVIDDRVPSHGRDAGSEAILSHMRALRRLGYDVTFVPSTLRGDGAALEAEGFATCLHPWYASVEDLLRRQAGAFDLVYLHRMANATRYLGLARQHQPKARIVYSLADLHCLRTMRQADVEDRPELRRLGERQRVSEFAAAGQCDAVITHSTFEAGLLRAHLPPGKVHVVPWSMPPRPTATPFVERRGVAFVAHYAHQPNADAARILLEKVMPAVWEQDDALPCLLAGSDMPDWVRDLARAPARALGAVADLASVFDRVRLSVAPLSFGAGIKGKVLASLAAGIPCACTTIAAEGLDLPPPLSELVADDAAALAALILRLDRDDAFNARCAEAGLDYVATRLSEDVVDQLMAGVLR